MVICIFYRMSIEVLDEESSYSQDDDSDVDYEPNITISIV